MGPILIDEWLGDAERIATRDEASVSIVREGVRAIAATLALDERVTGALVNVASELAHNQLKHASRGEILFRAVRRGDVPGLEIVAADRGEGIANATDAIAGKMRSAGSLGVGLAAVLELADEVDFDVRIGEGTCVWARKFAEPVAKARQVGIYARPHPEERTCGDQACFVRDGDSDALLVAVVDGVGHGEPAREAANLAVRAVRARAKAPLDEILRETNEALVDTRGAVMALARFPSRERAEIALVGNVAVHLDGPDIARRASGVAGMLGSRTPMRRPSIDALAVGPWDALVAFTDGLTTATDAHDLDLLREHPIAIAHQLAMRHGRGTDDLLVLAVR